MIMRASQAENVLVVGENTLGCLTFGNIAVHQLPHSRLLVQLPINFGMFLDGISREGEGLAPDLWVPAADAVNYAVAALRRGTLSTVHPLSPETLAQPFAPEDPWARNRRERTLLALVTALFIAGSTTWAWFARQKPRLVMLLGSPWLLVGAVALLRDQPVGWGMASAGLICLLWGGFSLLRAHPPAPPARS